VFICGFLVLSVFIGGIFIRVHLRLPLFHSDKMLIANFPISVIIPPAD
jgi:hypothetical protein